MKRATIIDLVCVTLSVGLIIWGCRYDAGAVRRVRVDCRVGSTLYSSIETTNRFYKCYTGVTNWTVAGLRAKVMVRTNAWW